MEIRREHGVLEWERNSGRTYEMRNIDVEPAYWRQGIGRSLMQEFEAIVRSAGGLSIYGFTAGDNDRAQAFYRAIGYALILIPGLYGIGLDGYLFHKAIA